MGENFRRGWLSLISESGGGECWEAHRCKMLPRKAGARTSTEASAA